MVEGIREFKNEFSFLSNFYAAELVWGGMLWPTAEHAYQAAKTLHTPSRMNICNLPTPGQAKRAGKTLVLRSDWEQIKYDTMKDIVRCKFKHNPDLLERLLDTGDAHLEEGNWHHDQIWGVYPPVVGSGQNLLGKVLMEIREELREQS